MDSKVLLPLTKEEVSELNRTHSNIDSAKWVIPNRVFPKKYKEFLSWSNGGSFLNGEREFSPFFEIEDIRDMMLEYEFPEYIQGAVPIAFDGGGTFYFFDMRQEPVNGEYPIYFAGAGALFWEDAIYVADSFNSMLLGQTDPHGALD